MHSDEAHCNAIHNYGIYLEDILAAVEDKNGNLVLNMHINVCKEQRFSSHVIGCRALGFVSLAVESRVTEMLSCVCYVLSDLLTSCVPGASPHYILSYTKQENRPHRS